MAVPNTDDDLAAGIPDPNRPDRWLVTPWPAGSTFREVVRHFLGAYVHGLIGDPHAGRQLAYFEGYHAALLAASTRDITGSADWHWHDELVGCVTECVAVYRAKQVTA